jgi:cytochrome P450
MRTGVEELARFAGPIQMGAAPRTATCDVEMHGKQIREGDVLRTVLASANRDPEVFADPERLDFRRTDVQAHVAYSHGAHFCLGAALARLETELAIRGLLDRFPKIDIAGPVEWKTDISVRGLTGLPVGTH